MGWVGVDLDGTLAKYEGWVSPSHIGEPVPAMLKRVKEWVEQGVEVRIFTARVGAKDQAEEAAYAIREWCIKHIGHVLMITNVKDYAMVELWDDCCVQVEPNTGRRMDGEM